MTILRVSNSSKMKSYIKSHRIGEIALNNQGLKMEIVEYLSATDISVRFKDGTIVKNKQYGSFTRGKILNNNSPSVESIGFLGYGKYYGITYTKFLTTWSSMLSRCYGSYSSKNLPTYKDCTVDPRWHNFQNFAAWFEENYVENWHLDKDILVSGNKIYGPDTCCFVPSQINAQFRKSREPRYSKGVSKHKNKFNVYLSIEGTAVYIGTSYSLEEAIEIQSKAKKELLFSLAEKYKEKLDYRVYNILTLNLK